MKTNMIMERPLANFTVEQRTKDAFFNATSILRQWNEQPNVAQRKMDNYFASPKTIEFIQTIMNREKLDTPKMVYVKSKARADRGGGTWMHPLMFVDFAIRYWYWKKVRVPQIKLSEYKDATSSANKNRMPVYCKQF